MNNTEKIKNGSLYFNKRSRRVERVLGKLNTTRVWTASHETGAGDVRIKDIRLAKPAEVSSYLEETTPELV
jgi:hypothetical protein